MAVNPNDPFGGGGSLGAPPSQKFVMPPLQNLGDVLDFVRASTHEAIFHKGSSDANRASLRALLAKLPDAKSLPAGMSEMPMTEFYQLGARAYDKLPQVARGIYDAMLDSNTDPMTLATLDTAAVARFGGRLLSPLMRSIDKAHLPVWGPGLLSDLSAAGNRVLNFGGEAINKVGRGKWMQAVGMLNRQRGESKELFRRLQEIDQGIMKGLSPAQTSRVQKILHGQLPPDLEAQVMSDPMVAQAVRQRKELTDNLARLQASPDSAAAIEAMIGGRPLPKALEPFAGHPGEFNVENLRKRYFPGHLYGKAVDPNAPAAEVSLLDRSNPHIREQQDFHIASKDVDKYEQAFQGMLKTSANSITTNKARNELARIYGGVANIPQPIRDIFTLHIPATGTERSVGQKAQEAIKGLVNLPKLGIVGTTPIHMFNILSLLAVRAPEQIPSAVMHMARIVRAGGNESKRFQALLPAIERGIDIAAHEKSGTLLSKLPLNRLTWDWDAAAKLALSDKYIKQGMDPIEAGVRASNELVNYGNKSRLTDNLQWVMPFATFAEGGAKAVGSAVAKNPAQVETLNRLLGGRLLGGGNQKKDVTLYQPPANFGRGLPTYLRSKTSDLVKLPIAMGASVLPGGDRMSRWILSGRTPLGTAADIATSPIPYARDILDMIPLKGGKTVRGYAPDAPLNQGVFSSTGISLPSAPKAAASGATKFDPANPFGGGTAAPSLGSPPSAKPAVNPADPFGGTKP